MHRIAKTLALCALALTCALTIAPAAFANNVGSATSASFGGPESASLPSNGHLVYRVSLSAGDWVAGYAWAPSTRDAAAQIRVLEPSASDVASDAVATSTPSGVLLWRAPVAGTYYCDFSGTIGTQIWRGIFRSRPTLALATPPVVAIPYNSSYTPACTFSDPLYTYVPYDEPKVGFETVTLSSARGTNALKAVWSGSTDLNGSAGHLITGITHNMRFAFDYAGALYDSSAFGPTTSPALAVYARVQFTILAPTVATHGRSFRLSGTVLPRSAAGPSSTRIEAHKLGSSTLLTFGMNAIASSTGATPLRGGVTLPTAGTWYVRLHRLTDADNAETATKWVRVHVR